MSSYALNTSIERTVLLTLAGSPVSGITSAAVTVDIKKAGQATFSNMVLNPSEWIDMGGGFYTVTFLPVVTDVPGTFAYKITGAGFDNLIFEQIVLMDPANSGSQQSYFQDTPSERTVFLSLAGVPATNIAYADVACQTKKAGHNAFSNKILNIDNWINLGGGYYTIRFSGSDMSKVGSFVYTLAGVGFDNFAYDEFAILAAPDTTVEDKCIVTGKFISLSGNKASQIKVCARAIEFPAKSGNRIVAADVIWTTLSYDGSFELPLLRGATVIVEVPRAGIRHQIEIPDTPSAELTQLLPPFAVDYTL